MNLQKFLTKVFVPSILIFTIFSAMDIKTVRAEESEKELFLVAQSAFDDGFYDVAMRYIQDYLKKYPQTEKRIQAKLILGQCYFFKNQYLQAFETFNSLVQYSEFKDATLFWLGETYLKGSDFAQAEKQYLQLIELFPDSIYAPQGYYSLAWCYFDQKKYTKAIEYFQQLITKFPAHALSEDAAFKLGESAYNLTKYDEGIDYFSQYVVGFPKSPRHDQAYFYMAESYYYQGDYSKAIPYYDKVIQISDDKKLVIMSQVSTGWGYLKIKDFLSAQKAFDNALLLAKEKGILSDDIFLGQASLYTEMKEPEKALTAYEEIIVNFPKSSRLADAYLGKANILYSLKKYPDAVATYQMVIDKFSGNPEFKETLEKANFGLAWTYLKSGDIDMSIKSFQTIMEGTENKIVKISALTQIGDAYQDIGKLEQALEVYDRILREFPDTLYSDYVQYRQAITLLKLEKTDAALLSFKSLKANFPQSKYIPESEYYIGVVYFKNGDWAAAKEQTEQFIMNTKDNDFLAEAHYIRALSFFNLGDSKKAMELFNELIKKFPTEQSMIRDSEISIAKCLYNLGDSKEAIRKFKIIAFKYPNTDVAQESLLWLGDYYLETGELNNAVSFYQQAITKFPDGERTNIARLELGQAYKAQGALDKALNQFKLITDPNDKELYAKAQLAIADIFSKELDPENAINTYQSIAKSCPDFKRDAFVKIAELYQANQDYKMAVDSYQKALDTEIGLSQFSNAQLQFLIGDLYEMLNSPQEAAQMYLKIPYLYPKEKEWVIKSYLRVARIFEDKGDWENAKVTYGKIIDLGTGEVTFAQERLDWIKENGASVE